MRRLLVGMLTIALVVGLAIALILQAGCTRKIGSKLGKDAYPQDYAIAVVRATEYFESAFIEYYDEELELVACMEYPYADLENRMEPPFSSEGVVYIAHRGKAFERMGCGVVGISLETGEATEYSLETPVSMAAATKDYIFGLVDAGSASYITRIDKDTGEYYKQRFADVLFRSIAVGEDFLLVASDPLEGEADELLVIDESLEITQRISLEELESCYRIAEPIGDRFYFGAATYNTNEGTYAGTLNYYSTSDRQIHTILSGYSCLTLDVFAHDGYLFVVQFDVNNDQENKVLVLDQNTYEIVGVLPLPFQPTHTVQKDDLLYLAGYYKETGRDGLIKYRIEGTQLTQLHESSLNQEVTELGDRQRSGYFVSGLFFKEQ
jgi:hypothetical protein